jgi:hypothetical protein
MTKSLSCSSNHEVHHTQNRKRKFELNIYSDTSRFWTHDKCTAKKEKKKDLQYEIHTKHEKEIVFFKEKPQSYRRLSVVRLSSTHVEAVIFIEILQHEFDNPFVTEKASNRP